MAEGRCRNCGVAPGNEAGACPVCGWSSPAIPPDVEGSVLPAEQPFLLIEAAIVLLVGVPVTWAWAQVWDALLTSFGPSPGLHAFLGVVGVLLVALPLALWVGYCLFAWSRQRGSPDTSGPP